MKEAHTGHMHSEEQKINISKGQMGNRRNGIKRKNEEDNVDKNTFSNRLLIFFNGYLRSINFFFEKFKNLDFIKFLNLFSILILITSLSKLILQMNHEEKSLNFIEQTYYS